LAIEDEMMMQETVREAPAQPSAPAPVPEGASPTLNQAMGQEQSEMMMAADPNIQIVLMSRLEQLAPEDLQQLDRVIDGNTARILMKLLPELEPLMTQLSEAGIGGGGNAEAEMGALGGMM
tara:strand:+ start:841 stop:1203 length:363 start_codon:yes stop_codon:yes gene_type:complete